ncbi:MAG: iron export ABC transporter permease subunit FetB [Pseudomonadota bacterium]
MNVIQLQPLDLVLASSLLLFDAAISVVLSLGMHRQLLWSSVRMVIQLLVVGGILHTVFSISSPLTTLGIIVVMMMAATYEVAARPSQKLSGWQGYRIGAITISLTSSITVLIALLTAIRPIPWYDARYAIPLMGIVVGNVLTSASLGIDTFLSGLFQAKGVVEARLALGETSQQALSPLIRDAIRKGLIPIINQMSATGLITLPGIMTGQILAGAEPMQAVKYQILFMFLLAGGGGLAAVVSVYLTAHAVTDKRHRLRLDCLVRRRK